MATIKISEIKWDRTIYPRSDWSKSTAERYADAMSAGDIFPPIILQKDTNVLLDGKHRYEAYKIAGIDEVPFEWNVIPEGMSQKYFAAILSSRHGDRLSNKDLETLAREEFERDASIDPTRWGERLALSKSTVYRWVSDILTKAKAGRELKAWRLAKLGWTLEEIASVLGIKKTQAGDDISENSQIGNIGNSLGPDWNAKGLAAEAERLGIRETDAWAAALDGMEDKAIFEKLDWGIRTWDNWAFNSCDNRFGEEWPGRIPAQLVAHTLFYFTKTGDVVFDPMAGGGVVSDTCLVFGRKCFSFDLSARDYRPEIVKHQWDAGHPTFPEFMQKGRSKKIDLLFFDPPYFTKKEKEYDEKAGDDGVSISSLSREEYLEFFKKFFIAAKDYMKPDGRIAFLNADWRDFQHTAARKESPEKAITIFDYHHVLDKAGWEVTHRISVPLSTERFSGNVVAKMQEGRILGVVTRDLLMARRRANG